MARILIADDDRDYLAAFSQGMAALGHETTGVDHSDDVLPALDGAPYDIVFLDMLMPGGGAITLVHRISSAHPALPVVVLTGNAAVFSSPIMQGGMRHVHARISKTSSLAEIGQVIHRLI